jgi:hypothetical protein
VSIKRTKREVRKPAKPRGLPRERLAKAIVQIFRIILGYGCELGLADCLKLAEMTGGMEFRKENEENQLARRRRRRGSS